MLWCPFAYLAPTEAIDVSTKKEEEAPATWAGGEAAAGPPAACKEQEHPKRLD